MNLHGKKRLLEREAVATRDCRPASRVRSRNAAGLILAALAVFPVLGGCGNGEKDTSSAAKEVQCITAPAEARAVPLTVPATGSLVAERTVHISTRLMGWVREIHVDEGDWVAVGDPLISIDDSDLIAKRAQVDAGIVEAEAVLANAEKMVVRFEKLYAENSVSKQQLDDVLTGRDRAAAGRGAARAMRDEINVHLSYLEITAPAPALVTRKMVEVGDMANPGAPLLELEDNRRMKVIAHLGEKYISLVRLDDMISVDVTSLPDAKFVVPIEEIIHSANPGSRTYDIEAYLDNRDGRLKSGMFASVEVPVGERTAVLIPAASVIKRGQLRGVFVVAKNETARLRWVRLGHAWGDDVEVLSGLDGGESVVVSAAAPLVEGDKVVR